MKDKFAKIFELIKSKKWISIGIISVVIIIIIIIVSTGNNTFAETPDNSISINCPETASAGETIECNIDASIINITSFGISTSYNTTLGLEYISFTADNIWTVYNSSENGFALGNMEGVTGAVVIGTLKYKIPDDAESNDTYNIALNEVIFSDENFNGIEVEGSSAQIRILSDINTLDGITITGGTLNEEFASGTTNYTGSSNEDHITIEVEKTDDNSVVTGDVGEVELHYGTNNLSVIVTSESGTSNTYTLNIFRPYEFSSDNYIYNKENNYLYTRTDTEADNILSNIDIPDELTAGVNDNKLIIKYSDEQLLEINLINIYSNKYKIVNDTIYVGENTTYETFNSNLTLNGVTVKVFNGTEEVSEGNLTSEYKVKVYYDSTELEIYNISEEYLNFDESLSIDNTNKIIKRIPLNTTYSSLLEKIDTTGNITIKRGTTSLSNSEKVHTGDKITITLSSGTYNYTVSVLGDINGDGQINLGDVSLLYKHLKGIERGRNQLENYKEAAGDIINDGSIKINDVSRLYRFYKEKVTTLEVNR